MTCGVEVWKTPKQQFPNPKASFQVSKCTVKLVFKSFLIKSLSPVFLPFRTIKNDLIKTAVNLVFFLPSP